MCNILRLDRKEGLGEEGHLTDLVTGVVEDGQFPFTPRYIFTFKVLGTDMPKEALALRLLSVVREDTLESVTAPEDLTDKMTRAAANLLCEDFGEAW